MEPATSLSASSETVVSARQWCAEKQSSYSCCSGDSTPVSLLRWRNLHKGL
ncbi:hypothetical protein OIU77_006667 [Salix suchowensis]|uniref:Uncharacterized protein n=1 Tax=Salix suchowensis TaxID=1278906 RepID=A0ABQ9ALP4_9ROSI|nr:hypothetical protein OIU77_006667 [Salix suchowensis]